MACFSVRWLHVWPGGSMERPSSFQLVGLRETLLQSILCIFLITMRWRRSNTCSHHLVRSIRSRRPQDPEMPVFMEWLASRLVPLHTLRRRCRLFTFRLASQRLTLFQVRFSLSASPVFSRTDTITDSEKFYTTILELLYNPAEKREVDALFVWWNR